jgi:TPR repeat protein
MSKLIATTLLAISLVSEAAFAGGMFGEGEDSGVKINDLSNYESGTRLHEAGNIPMAIIMFQQGADAGDPKSEFALGTYYYFGEGVKKDLERARKLFESSDSKDNAESAYMLALMYRRGESVAKDDVASQKYLIKAAHACIEPAQSDLSKAYYEGIGVQKDELEGIAWLYLAAEQNDQETQDTVAQILDRLSKPDREFVEARVKTIRSESNCTQS